jgi:hypothetical protein
MKTGSTIDRLDRAATALTAAASALNHGRNALFVERLEEGLRLVEEVLFHSEKLTPEERLRLCLSREEVT